MTQESDQRDGLAEALAALPARTAGSDQERRAANALAEEIRARGGEPVLQPIRVRAGVTGRIVLHALAALAGGLLALALPLAGAAVALIAAASFYLDRSGLTGPLTCLFPLRASQNVVVEPAGEAPSGSAGPPVLIAAGYDAPPAARSPHESIAPLARLLPAPLATRATPARIAFWLGAVPLLACSMARAGGLDGIALDVVQMAASVLSLVAVAVLIDRAASGPADPAQAASAAVAPEAAIEAWAALRGRGEGEAGLLLAGADELGAAGASAFFRSRRAELRRRGCAVLNLLPPFTDRPVHGSSEGELIAVPASAELTAAAGEAASAPLALVAATAAGAARRSGLPAVSLSAPTAERTARLAAAVARSRGTADGI